MESEGYTHINPAEVGTQPVLQLCIPLASGWLGTLQARMLSFGRRKWRGDDMRDVIVR